MRHVIFDFDGVLIDSFAFHLEKVNELFGVELTPEEYRSVHDGNFYRGDFEKFSNIDWREYDAYVHEAQTKLPLVPGAKAVLEKLYKKHTLHLITSGWQRQVSGVLKANGVLDLFTSGYFADHGFSKHEKFLKLFAEHGVEHSDCIFVTDTLGDLKEAHSLNIASIAVTFGFHDKERLEKGDPDHFADSWAEIVQILTLK